jgi:2-dehydro-3-deoxyphosphogluconate aldolase/(4S)-4-hydroxy-2-oxoglutarate aldolase
MHISRGSVLRELEDCGVVAIIRAVDKRQVIDVCRALFEGGVIACEITMTTPGALAAIEQASTEIDGCHIGVGSVLDPETARAAILSGARFVVSPVLEPAMIEVAHRYDCLAIPGALTPTEVARAWSLGADVVKIFPANHFGPRYIRDLHGPMPQLKLIPTGGVDLDSTREWIAAGAAMIGAGSALVRAEFLHHGDWDGLTAMAHRYVECVRLTRANPDAGSVC